MTFKEFKNTIDYVAADVIDFVDTNRIPLDIDNLEDETLDNIEVVDFFRVGGYLEITLN